MTINGHRGPSPAPPKTAAATAAKKRQYAQRIAGKLAPRTGMLSDDAVVALAANLIAQADRRGLLDPLREALAELFDDGEVGW